MRSRTGRRCRRQRDAFDRPLRRHTGSTELVSRLDHGLLRACDLLVPPGPGQAERFALLPGRGAAAGYPRAQGVHPGVEDDLWRDTRSPPHANPHLARSRVVIQQVHPECASTERCAGSAEDHWKARVSQVGSGVLVRVVHMGSPAAPLREHEGGARLGPIPVLGNVEVHDVVGAVRRQDLQALRRSEFVSAPATVGPGS